MDKEFWNIPKPSSQGSNGHRWSVFLWGMVEMYLFRPTPKIMNGWRCFLLRMFGAKIGKGCNIASSSRFIRTWDIELGNYVTIDDDCWIDGPVTLDDYCSLSKCVKLISDGHNVRSRSFDYVCDRIVLDANVFIGADTYVSKGVHIGQFACIGSHSFVVKDIPENTIAYGNPCVVHSERIPFEEYKKYRFK